MKTSFFVLLLNIAMLVNSGCGRGTVLQFDDAKITVQTKTVNSILHLQITGLVFASALAVSHIDAIVNSDETIILVYVVHAREGLSGAIDYDLDIGPKVSRVCFGDAKHIIWSRKSE